MLPLSEIAAKIAAKYRLTHPDWAVTDSPLKYVDWAFEQTLAKSDALADLLAPSAGSRIFEFGPGAGFLLFAFKTKYACQVSGCDIADRPLYKEVQAALGIDTVTDEAISAGQSITALCGKYAYLIGTQISWMDAWDQGDLDFFLQDVAKHLTQGGRIVLFPNPAAFRRVPPAEIFARHQPQWIELPWLGKGVVLCTSFA